MSGSLAAGRNLERRRRGVGVDPGIYGDGINAGELQRLITQFGCTIQSE